MNTVFERLAHDTEWQSRLDDLGRLHEHCKSLVEKVLKRYRVLANPDDVADCAAEVAETLRRKREKCVGREQAYGRGIAKNVVKRYLEKIHRQRRRNERVRAAAKRSAKAIEAQTKRCGSDKAIIDIDLDELRAYILRAHPHGWQPLRVFEASQRQGQDPRATAEALGMTPGAVYVNLHRFYQEAKAFLWMNGGADGWMREGEHESVDHLVVKYREVMNTVGYAAAVQAMWMHAREAWSSVTKSDRMFRLAAMRSIALAKWLQQCGDFDGAHSAIDLVRRGGSHDTLRHLLGEGAFEQLLAIKLKLEPQKFGTSDCKRMLERAAEVLRQPENRSKFFWRTGLDFLMHGQTRKVEPILRRYLALDHRLIPTANTCFVQSFKLFCTGRFDEACDEARKYRKIQEDIWSTHPEIPDPSIQGVLTGLYLVAFMYTASPRTKDELRKELLEFRLDLARTRAESSVGSLADGLREFNDLAWKLRPEIQQPLMMIKPRRFRRRKGTRRDIRTLIQHLNQSVPFLK